MERGHRRNAADTKARLLRAAQTAFAERGYASAGIRDIAELAGANSALLVRYFGSKAALFEAALVQSIDLDALTTAEKAGFGDRLSRHLLDEAGGAHRLAFAVPTNDATGAAIMARVTEEHAIRPLADWLGSPDARARAMKIVMLASAVCLFLRHNTLAASSQDETVSIRDWFATSVQAVVDERR